MHGKYSMYYNFKYTYLQSIKELTMYMYIVKKSKNICNNNNEINKQFEIWN
jgi:hypothetical protein